MPLKKLSGAQNRKRSAQFESDLQKSEKLMKTFLGHSEDNTVQIASGAQPGNDAESSDLPCSASENKEVGGSPERKDNSQDESIPYENERDSEKEPNSPGEGPSSEANYTSSFDTPDPALWPQVLRSADIGRIILNGPRNIKAMRFPVNKQKLHFSISHRQRVDESGEIIHRSWRIYSKSDDNVFCFCCKIFDRAAKSMLALSGYNCWHNIADALKNHEVSNAHLIAYSKWTQAGSRLRQNKCIDSENQRIINSEIAHWRNVLQRLISITLFLAKNNLAFQGSSDKLFTDHNGNFLGLVELLGKDDDVMRKHLKRVVGKEVKDHYCSKRLQNELLDIMASKVLENILMRLRKAKFYSVIMDCTSDISHIEEMSLTVRFFDDSDGQIKVKEPFVCFKPLDDSTGKGLTKLFINVLNENKTMLEYCRGQGYDNGANMKGKHSGVQARILALNPRAYFVPCACHSLNLVVSDAALSSLDSVTLFVLLQRIYTLFSASTIRWKVLTNNVRNLTVKPLSDTRWESHIDSVKAVRFLVTVIYDALMELAQLSKADAGVRHEAQSLANQITDFKFLVSLVVWHNILFQINIVSKTLHNKTVDIATATSLMKGCIQFFVAYRDNGFENAIIAGKEMAAGLGAEPAFKEIRIRQRKGQLDYECRDDVTQTQIPEEKFKREFFCVLVDTAHGSIEERFGQMTDHERCCGFLMTLASFLWTKKTLLEHCTNLHQTLKHDESSDINGKDLHVELDNIRYMLPRGTVTPLPVLEYIHDANLKNIFPNVWMSLKILLTLPVTVASGERSFSKLKLIKTYLRTTMANERLTLLAILSVENDTGQSLDLSDAVLQFARAKSRKVTF